MVDLVVTRINVCNHNNDTLSEFHFSHYFLDIFSGSTRVKIGYFNYYVVSVYLVVVGLVSVECKSESCGMQNMENIHLWCRHNAVCVTHAVY